MRYKVQKMLEIFGGREFWVVIDTDTGKQVSDYSKKHHATIDSATRNKSIQKEKEDGNSKTIGR